MTGLEEWRMWVRLAFRRRIGTRGQARAFQKMLAAQNRLADSNHAKRRSA